MKVCFPVEHNEGIGSRIYNHFGSAPMFIVIDTETKVLAIINNRDQQHAHGACNPMKALDNRQVDAVVVGGIGAGALTRLNQIGIRVFRAHPGTVRENIVLIADQRLPELTLQGCCGGHSNDGGCAH